MSDNQCEQAKVRSELFESIVNRSGFELLPGRYGGEYNNDQLAIKLDENTAQIMLGLKTLDEEGGAQLDCLSLGNFMQLTDDWLDVAIYSLGKTLDNIGYANKLKKIIARSDRVKLVVAVNLDTQKVIQIPVDL